MGQSDIDSPSLPVTVSEALEVSLFSPFQVAWVI